jgi:hypothetical protein
MTGPSRIKMVPLSVEQLQDMIKTLPRETAEKLREVSIESVDALMASIAGVEYEIKVDLIPHWRKPAKNEMEDMIRKQHTKEITVNGQEMMLQALKEMAKQMDVAALERYWDLLQELKAGLKP